MRSRRTRKPTLLGEAFAMKESEGWEEVADSMHIQEEIQRRRRKALLLVALVTGILAVVAGGIVALVS